MPLLVRILALILTVTCGLFLFLPAGKDDHSVSTREETAATVEARREVPADDGVNKAPVGAELESGDTTEQVAVYRWQDENGTLHFSDRPLDRGAQLHTPAPIGSYAVSPEIKQQERLERLRVEQLKSQLIVTAVPDKISSNQSANYTFSMTSASQKHGYVLLTGRITGGPACEQLRVYVRAKNNSGYKVKGQQDVTYQGFGSELFEMKPRSSWNGGSYNRPQWEIAKISALCLVK